MEDSSFFELPFFNTRNLDLDSKRLLAAQLKEWRERARPDELAATVLQLGPRYISQDVTSTHGYEPRREDFINCREYPCAHFNWPPPRAAPASFATAHNVLRIIEPLPFQTGLDLNSQVYTASFELDPGAGVTQAEEVIIKIYQMSLYSAVPDVVEDPAQPWDLWGMTSGMDEEWAYRQMQTLQGGIVPHVYGFFQVTLPHGEPSVAFIMEKIDSVSYTTIRQRLKSRYNTDEDAVKAVATAVLAADHAVHSCDVATQDDRALARNLLWHRDCFTSTGPSLPVLIDYGFVSRIRSSSQTVAIQRVVVVLRALGFSEALIKAWVTSLSATPNVDHAAGVVDNSWVLRLFDIPDDDAEEYPNKARFWT